MAKLKSAITLFALIALGQKSFAEFAVDLFIRDSSYIIQTGQGLRCDRGYSLACAREAAGFDFSRAFREAIYDLSAATLDPEVQALGGVGAPQTARRLAWYVENQNPSTVKTKAQLTTILSGESTAVENIKRGDLLFLTQGAGCERAGVNGSVFAIGGIGPNGRQLIDFQRLPRPRDQMPARLTLLSEILAVHFSDDDQKSSEPCHAVVISIPSLLSMPIDGEGNTLAIPIVPN